MDLSFRPLQYRLRVINSQRQVTVQVFANNEQDASYWLDKYLDKAQDGSVGSVVEMKEDVVKVKTKEERINELKRIREQQERNAAGHESTGEAQQLHTAAV